MPAPVVTVSFLWAQAPKLKAVAKTATIMISLNSFNYLASFRSRLLTPFRQGTTGKQRFSRLFWMCQAQRLSAAIRKKLAELQSVKRSRGPLFFNEYRCAVIDEIKQLNDVRIAHPNAPAAVGAANLVFVFCAVDVNEALASVGIVVVQSVQP